MSPSVCEGGIDARLLGTSPLSMVCGGRAAIYRWRTLGKQGGKEKTKGMVEIRQGPGDMFAMYFQLLVSE